MPRVGLPLGTNYDSTRNPVDSQKTINMYPHSSRGFRQFPGLVEFSSFAAPAYANDQRSLSSNYLARRPYISPNDPQKLWARGFDSSQTVLGYHTMSADYDISTMSSTPTAVTPTGLISDPSYDLFDFQVADSGKKLYLLIADARSTLAYVIVECSLGTPYDLETASTTGNTLDITDVILSGSPGVNFLISETGTKLIAYATDGHNAKDYALTTPFDLSTASATGDNRDLATDLSMTATSVLFSDPSNSLLFIVDGTDEVIKQFPLNSFTVDGIGSLQATLDLSADYTLNMLGANWINDGGGLVVCGTNTGSSNRIFRRYDTSGYTLFDASSVSGNSTFMKRMAGELYVVIGTGLYKITEAGGAVSLGTVASPTGMATDGTNLVIATGGDPFSYSTAGGVVSITDTDLGDAYTVAFLDRRFIFEQDGVNADFILTDINNPTSISALNRGVTGARDDNVRCVHVASQTAYMMGESTVEPFRTIGSGNPPVRRQTVLDFGILGRNAIDEIDEISYMIDDERRPRMLQGLSSQLIEQGAALGKELLSYTDVDDCVVSCFTFESENFASFYFASANKTWCYHITSGTWIELQDDNGDAFPVIRWEQAYGKTLGLSTDGKIYELSETNYQQDGSDFTRTKNTGLITSELFSNEAQDIEVEVLYLTFDCTGAAEVTVSIATDDDLATFSRSRTVSLEAGVQTVQLPLWGVMREGIFQIACSSNAGVDLVDAAADLTVLHG